MTDDLTSIERMVISGFNSGATLALIARVVRMKPGSVSSMATRLRNRGYKLPKLRPTIYRRNTRPGWPMERADGIWRGGKTTVYSLLRADAVRWLDILVAGDG